MKYNENMSLRSDIDEFRPTRKFSRPAPFIIFLFAQRTIDFESKSIKSNPLLSKGQNLLYLLMIVQQTFRKSSTFSLLETISRKLMIFLCFKFCRILISRMAVIGKPPLSFSKRTFFNATRSAGKQNGIYKILDFGNLYRRQFYENGQTLKSKIKNKKRRGNNNF